MSYLYQLSGRKNRFRAIAYQNVSKVISGLERDIADCVADETLEGVEGVGKSIAAKICEYLQTGKIKKYESMKEKYPHGLLELMEIRSVGPQTIKKLHRKFHITDKGGLIRVLSGSKIKKVKGFGEKKISKILKELKVHDQALIRMSLWEALQTGEDWVEIINQIPGVVKVELAGSLRRQKPTIGDIDLLISAEKKDHKSVIKHLTSYKRIKEVLGKGSTKVSVIDSHNGKQVDIRIVEPKVWGAALLYFTGSKEHNISLREIVKRRKLKISEYGLFNEKGKRIAGETEEEVYEKLGFKWIPPEMRENTGELDLSQKNNLPVLLEQNDILGDMELHSKWSDGHNSIEEIVDFIREHFHQYNYLVVTDHSKAVRIAGGLTAGEFKKQIKEIDRINDRLGKSFVKKGVEVDILKNGSLDLNDEVLSLFDWVNASIHSYFNQDNTERIIKACQNPYVNAIGHPTGQLAGVREAYPLDMKKIIRVAAETGTALEINAQPDRMDMDEIWTRSAREHGVKMIIGTDSHRLREFGFMKLGVSIARRAWCTRKDIINAMKWSEIEMLVKKKRKILKAVIQ